MLFFRDHNLDVKTYKSESGIKTKFSMPTNMDLLTITISVFLQRSSEQGKVLLLS